MHLVIIAFGLLMLVDVRLAAGLVIVVGLFNALTAK